MPFQAPGVNRHFFMTAGVLLQPDFKPLCFLSWQYNPGEGIVPVGMKGLEKIRLAPFPFSWPSPGQYRWLKV